MNRAINLSSAQVSLLNNKTATAGRALEIDDPESDNNIDESAMFQQSHLKRIVMNRKDTR